MSSPSSNMIAGFDTERGVTAPFTGAWQPVGSPLAFNPVIMVIDNLSTVPVELSIDGVNTWKTFGEGSALVLDYRANHGIAANFSVPLYTQFYVKGSAGAGLFSISILYAS